MRDFAVELAHDFTVIVVCVALVVSAVVPAVVVLVLDRRGRSPEDLALVIRALRGRGP